MHDVIYCLKANLIEKAAASERSASSSRLSAMDLKTLINQDDLEKALKCYLCSENIPDFVYQVSRGTEKVQGFMSVVLRVKVSFADGNKAVSFIVKIPPMSEVHLQYARNSDFFSRESIFFNTALPLLLKNLR